MLGTELIILYKNIFTYICSLSISTASALSVPEVRPLSLDLLFLYFVCPLLLRLLYLCLCLVRPLRIPFFFPHCVSAIGLFTIEDLTKGIFSSIELIFLHNNISTPANHSVISFIIPPATPFTTHSALVLSTLFIPTPFNEHKNLVPGTPSLAIGSHVTIDGIIIIWIYD